MARLPEGTKFSLQQKNAGQQNWVVVDEFIPDSANDYPFSTASEDANAAFVAAYTNHNGGEKEYTLLLCVEQAYEIRPVPEP